MQQHKVHLMIKVKVTLKDAEGHRLSSKVTKITNCHISQALTLTDIVPGTKVQYNKLHISIRSKISFLDLM